MRTHTSKAPLDTDVGKTLAAVANVVSPAFFSEQLEEFKSSKVCLWGVAAFKA